MNTKNKAANPLDKHLDAILRAGGSALKYYDEIGQNRNNMRATLSAAVAELARLKAGSQAKPVLLTKNQIHLALDAAGVMPDGLTLEREVKAARAIEAAVHAANPAPLTQAARDVLAERQRQISVEGWTPEHDDGYVDCELAAAAASYALCERPSDLKISGVTAWPWPMGYWKPSTYRRNLEKAGALIIAEIERLDHAELAKAVKS